MGAINIYSPISIISSVASHVPVCGGGFMMFNICSYKIQTETQDVLPAEFQEISQVGIKYNFLTMIQVVFQLKIQIGTQLDFQGSL